MKRSYQLNWDLDLCYFVFIVDQDRLDDLLQSSRRSDFLISEGCCPPRLSDCLVLRLIEKPTD